MNTQKKKRMAKGKGWLKPPAARPPITSYTMRKGKGQRRMKGQKKKKEGKERKAVVHSYSIPLALTFPSFHKTKAPNTAHLFPLLSYKHFLNASFPLKHTSLLPALLEPCLRSHITGNWKTDTERI